MQRSSKGTPRRVVDIAIKTVNSMIEINQSTENCLLATESLSKVIEREPKNAEAISTLGLIFYYQGNFQKSIELFDVSLAIKPELRHIIQKRKNASKFKKIFDQRKFREFSWIESVFYIFVIFSSPCA